MKMQQAFLDINGVKTPVITYGRWIEEESPRTTEPEDIILLIPGNPGVTGFYKMFMHILHEKTGYPVWIVGHAGHEVPKNKRVSPILPLKGNENIFGLQGQVEHKIDFVEKYVPRNARIHLVGHSIGTYMILEMLKNESFSSKVNDINLLFPAFEYVGDTRNGKFLSTFVKPIVWLIVFLSMIYTILPSVISNFLMFVYMKITGMPKMHFRTLVNFIEPSIMEKTFFLAFDEMARVKERNNEIIKANMKKIRILYGNSDGWAPPSFCEKIKNDIPGIYAEISEFDHAFVLKQSREVGDFVSEWIRKV